jgi:4-amino-4-deoxy-L-arabinose transferase-like glycosyltransferase
VLRCFRLGEQSLWIDEVFTWYSAGGAHPLGWTELRENVHGPLFSLLLHGWMRIAGDGEWALRMPSAVFGTATVPAIAWLARRWIGRDAGIAAAWLAAASPFLIWYSQEARNYALLILCVCVSTALLPGMAQRSSARGAAGYLVASAAGILSNLSFAFMAPLHLRFWIGPREGRSQRLGRMAWIVAGLALIASPWLAESWKVWDWDRLHPAREAPVQEAPLRGETTFHPGAVPFAAHVFSTGYTFGPSLRELRADGPARAVRAHVPAIAFSGIVFGVLLLIGLRGARRRGRLTDTLLWLLVPLAIVSYIASQNFKVFHPRYVAVAAPVWLLLLAMAFADLRPRARWMAGAAVGLIWAFSLWNHYFDPGYGREDFRGAAAIIRAQAAPGEQVLAVYSLEPMSYYMRGGLPVYSFWLGFAADSSRLDAELDAALDRANGSWVVLSRPEDLDPGDRFARRIETRFPEAGRYRTTGVRIWRLPARGAPELH